MYVKVPMLLAYIGAVRTMTLILAFANSDVIQGSVVGCEA